MPKVTLVEEKMYGPLPKMPLKRRGSILTEIEKIIKEISVVYGLPELMLVLVNTV